MGEIHFFFVTHSLKKELDSSTTTSLTNVIAKLKLVQIQHIPTVSFMYFYSKAGA